jgi:hypothetical protein
MCEAEKKGCRGELQPKGEHHAGAVTEDPHVSKRAIHNASLLQLF